jgi:hypothetical protein
VTALFAGPKAVCDQAGKAFAALHWLTHAQTGWQSTLTRVRDVLIAAGDANHAREIVKIGSMVGPIIAAEIGRAQSLNVLTGGTPPGPAPPTGGGGLPGVPASAGHWVEPPASTSSAAPTRSPRAFGKGRAAGATPDLLAANPSGSPFALSSAAAGSGGGGDELKGGKGTICETCNVRRVGRFCANACDVREDPQPEEPAVHFKACTRCRKVTAVEGPVGLVCTDCNHVDKSASRKRERSPTRAEKDVEAAFKDVLTKPSEGATPDQLKELQKNLADRLSDVYKRLPGGSQNKSGKLEEGGDEKRAFHDREGNEEAFVRDATRELAFVPLQRVRTTEMIVAERTRRAMKAARPEKGLTLEGGLLVAVDKERVSTSSAVTSWEDATARWLTLVGLVGELHPSDGLVPRMLTYWAALRELITAHVPLAVVMKCDVNSRLAWAQPADLASRKLLWGTVNEHRITRAYATASAPAGAITPSRADRAAAAGSAAEAGAVPARKARKTKRVSAAAGHAQPAAPAPPALNVAPAARPKGAGAVVAKKDKPCHFYRGGKGSCRSGDACEFSHTAEWKDARNPKE